MKKLVSLTLALLIALLALLPAVAEEGPTIRCGVLSMLNVTEAEMLNYRTARNLIGRQLEKEGLVTHRVRQILGCCRHIFYGKKRRLRKQSAAGNASFHKLSPVSVRPVFCPHSPDGKVKSRMHPVFAGASPGCLPGS